MNDDVIGDTESTYWFGNLGTGNGYGTFEGEGYLNLSYYDSTFVDDRGYFNIKLPRNNYYRMSFFPPDNGTISVTTISWSWIDMELQTLMIQRIL